MPDQLWLGKLVSPAFFSWTIASRRGTARSLDRGGLVTWRTGLDRGQTGAGGAKAEAWPAAEPDGETGVRNRCVSLFLSRQNNPSGNF